MPVPKRKETAAPARKVKKPFPVGPDGKTANQRLRDLLKSHPTVKREKDLWRLCNEVLGTGEDDPDFVRQQSINRILLDKDSLSRSKLVAALAEVMGVRALWLQTGRGDRFDRLDAIVKEILERHGMPKPT